MFTDLEQDLQSQMQTVGRYEVALVVVVVVAMESLLELDLIKSGSMFSVPSRSVTKSAPTALTVT